MIEVKVNDLEKLSKETIEEIKKNRSRKSRIELIMKESVKFLGEIAQNSNFKVLYSVKKNLRKQIEDYALEKIVSEFKIYINEELDI